MSPPVTRITAFAASVGEDVAPESSLARKGSVSTIDVATAVRTHLILFIPPVSIARVDALATQEPLASSPGQFEGQADPRDESRAAVLLMEVLAALVVGELPRHLRPRDGDQVVEVERPHADQAVEPGGGEHRTVGAELDVEDLDVVAPEDLRLLPVAAS